MIQKIKKFEKAIQMKHRPLKELGINPALFWAYRNSLRVGNEFIDFGGEIWERDIPEIVKQLKEESITEFTVSSGYSGLIPVLEKFEEAGFYIDGTCRVNATWMKTDSDDYDDVPALKLKLQA